MSTSKGNHTLAVLAVDLQPVFLDVAVDGAILAGRCCFALESAAHLGIPVFLTEQYPEKLGHTAPAILAAAGDGAKVFPKTAFSAFGADGLVEALEDACVRHLLVMGLETPICIYQTVLDATGRDIACTLLTDCIGARRQGDAEVCLDFLRGTTDCHVLPSETIFYSLLRDAKDPLFRDFTKLVKKYAAS